MNKQKSRMLMGVTAALALTFVMPIAGLNDASAADYKEYKVISAPQGQDLQHEVNALIRQGWQPIGGVSMRPEFKDFQGRINAALFSQAVAK